MKNLTKFIYITNLVFIIFAIALCEKVDDVDYAKDDADIPHSLYDEEIAEMFAEENLVDPHSFYYDRANKMMIKEGGEPSVDVLDDYTERKAYAKKSESTESKEKQMQCAHERIFYKRLINLLLANINIQGDDDNGIIGTLRIEASASQVTLLRNIDIEKTSLRELDTVLSDIIKKPKYDYIAKIGSFLDHAATIFKWTIEMIMENRDACIMFLMIIISFLVIGVTWRRGLPLLALIDVILVISFFMTWWQLLQEAEVKMRAAQMQFAEIPIACQPDKMNLWHKISASLFSSNDCEKYYETVMSNPQLKVTPALVLTHFFSNVILHPITHVGHVISTFIDNATANLPWTYAWAVKLLLFSSICFVIVLLPFCLSGASINFGLGPLFRFGINSHERSKNNQSLQDSAKREPLQIILQVPHNANVQALTNISENSQAQMIEFKKTEGKDDSQEPKERININLSSGDKVDKNERCEEIEVTKHKKEVGGGDS